MARLLNTLRSLLGSADKSSSLTTRVVVAAQNETAATYGGLSPAGFEGLIQKIISSGKPIRPGQLIVLRASEIASAFGDAWHGLADRAETIASQTIRRHLDSDDHAYFRLDTLSYVLSLPSCDMPTARRMATSIAAEIAEQLLGGEWNPRLLKLATVFGQFPDHLESEAIAVEAPRAQEFLKKITERAEEAHIRPDAPASQTSIDDPLGSATLLYRPMWDVRLRALSTYLAVPSRRTAGGDILPGWSELAGRTEADLHARLDTFVVERVAEELERSLSAGRKFMLAMPVHFETLAARESRTTFLAACEAIPPQATRLVIFELIGLPTGVPTARLLTMCSMLKSRARAIIACLRLESGDFGPCIEAGILSVGCDIGKFDRPERTIIEQMQRFAAAAEKAKLYPFVHGLRTKSLTSAAIAAGFRYVDGNSVRSLVDAPQELRRFGLAELYRLAAGARP